MVWCVLCSSGGGAATALMAPGTSSDGNHLLKEQAQRRRLQQARLPAAQAKASVDKPLFGPPIQVSLPYLTLGVGRLLHLPSAEAVSVRPNAQPRCNQKVTVIGCEAETSAVKIICMPASFDRTCTGIDVL